jgi:general secretion pathway protein C
MDLAKVFAEWRNQPPEQWLAQVNRVLPPIAVSVLVIVLAFQAAGLTWRLLDRPAEQDELPPAVVVVAAATPRSGGSGTLTPLHGWEPFGSAPEPGEEVLNPEGDLSTIPDTRLDLRLWAVNPYRASVALESGESPEEGAEGTATISLSGGTQRTYHTGDAIEGTSVTLHSVFPFCVMLGTGGSGAEKLCFPETAEPGQYPGRPGGNRTAAQPFRAPQTIGTPAAAASAVTSAAAIFNQHIQVATQTEGDKVIGYRLQPRNNSSLMRQLGLEPGDVLVEVNGVRLDNLGSVNAVLQALQETQQANVIVQRNGVNQPMTIDMGQIARLAESLQ